MKRGCGVGMEEDFLILLDSSGSMSEEGKRAAGEYLLRAMVGFVRDSFPEMRIGAYACGVGVVHYGDKSAGDDPKLHAEALAAFAAEHKDTPMILLSDGIFSERDRRALAGLSGSKRICAVMVGADANRSGLQKLLGRDRVFEPADALECARQLLALR